MGQLVTVVGNSGIGKTTLTAALGRLAPFAIAQEQHTERPFQALMKADASRFALANQLDYLLYRAEQERAIRQSPAIGLVDGGLDLDFFGFTQLFHHKGYLSDTEFALCSRLYRQLRAGLGPPDLVLRLVAPLDIVARRHAQRGRPLEIAEQDDLVELGQFVDSWLDGIGKDDTLTIDVSADDPLSTQQLQSILDQIRLRLDAGPT